MASAHDQWIKAYERASRQPMGYQQHILTMFLSEANDDLGFGDTDINLEMVRDAHALMDDLDRGRR